MTIFGAGVTGLTAAHELVERGFYVQVWEPTTNERFPWLGCDVGGMARTQWTRVHWPERHDLEDSWPKIQPNLQELRHFTRPVAGAPVPGWYGVPAEGSLVSAEAAMAELLARVPDDDPVPWITAVVYAEKPPGAPEDWWKSHRDATTSEIAAASGGSEEGAGSGKVRVRRSGFRDVRIRVLFRTESPWMLAASEAYRRVEFYYSPPWGTRTEPIVHVPQKFYVHRREPRKGAEEPPRLYDCEETPPGFENPDARQPRPTEPDPTCADCAKKYCLSALGEAGSREPDVVVAEVLRLLIDNPNIRFLYVEVADRTWTVPSSGPVGEDPGWDRALAWCLQEEFQRILEGLVGTREGVQDFPLRLADVEDDPDGTYLRTAIRLGTHRVVDITVARISAFPDDAPDCTDVILRFRPRERWFPGEHGYRFFPAFYRHVFDTMRRTPILVPAKKSDVGAAQERAVGVRPDVVKYTESFREVFDNIKPQDVTGLAFTRGRKPTLVPRCLPSSLSEALSSFDLLLRPVERGGFGLTPTDWIRFNLKILEYLTSSPERRETYEDVSWWEFIRADTYTPAAQLALARFPKALVAMDAVEGDARTIGSSGVQTFLDQLNPAGYRDGTLRGPTSEAWFKYWRRYLEAQGVDFVHGKIAALDVVDGKEHGAPPRLWPRVDCYDPTYPCEMVPEGGKLARRPCLPNGYFLLALPADEMKRIAEDVVPKAFAKGIRHRDLERAAAMELGDPTRVNPGGELRHFAGIQFYFEEDVFSIDGHFYYPDSPWAVTSISQARFWEDKGDWEHGYRGILSAIIGKWDVPGRTVRKCAWECTEEELAREVWAQISEALQIRDATEPLSLRLPRPLFFHLDTGMTFVEDASEPNGGHWVNRTPFQIETPGRFACRPGELDYQGYSHEQGVVLAGTFAKTHTRITSMEAANESARHAVNSILVSLDSPFRRTPCDIWPIEDREIEDFEEAKEVDRTLFQQGLPHVLEILGTDRFLQSFGDRIPSFMDVAVGFTKALRELRARPGSPCPY
ncbi:MAG TPA: hypothetical protein VHE30_25175 [Polyangiaceae bacterium]|nr:hypothetical protein [Polyangiaceae bacterium]